MFSLEVARENELVSDEVMDEVESINGNGTCQCGEELVFTDNLVNVFCPNRKCFYKIGARLEEMAKMLGVDGFGNSTCVDICRQLLLESPIEVFELTDEEIRGLDGVSAAEKKFSAIKGALDKVYKLHEVARLLKLKGLDTSATKLFRGFNTMAEFYEKFDAGKVKFVSEKLGIGKGTESILAIDIYKTLDESRDELYKAEKIFKIAESSVSGAEIMIAITGGVNGYTKSKFISHINSKLGGKLTVVMGNSVTAETKYLVCDEDESGSSKYTAALKKGTPIVSSKELIQILGV